MSQSHYTFLSPLFANPELEKFAAGILIGGGLTFLSLQVARYAGTTQARHDSVIPPEKPGLFGFLDLAMESFINYHDSILGKENRKHVAFHAAVFFFLLISNLTGLVPGMPAATTTVWTTAGLGLIAFFYFNLHGVRAHGVVGYLKHFCGPVWYLAWLLFPIEIFSVCLRPLTLNLRLYWNITADHMVLSTLTDILQVGVFPVYVLGVFVSFMQAFVFTTLSMVYVLLATEHEEEEHGHPAH